MAYPPLRVVHIEEERLRIFIPKQSVSRVTSSRRGIAFKEDSADEMSEEETEEDSRGFVVGNRANKVYQEINLLL